MFFPYSGSFISSAQCTIQIYHLLYRLLTSCLLTGISFSIKPPSLRPPFPSPHPPQTLPLLFFPNLLSCPQQRMLHPPMTKPRLVAASYTAPRDVPWSCSCITPVAGCSSTPQGPACPSITTSSSLRRLEHYRGVQVETRFSTIACSKSFSLPSSPPFPHSPPFFMLHSRQAPLLA